ncbi:hypothetical protein [Hymenobacter edaphi]|uniref:Uncharacterized protein n=1 Tax=Hymenobacter edaphi TaxID=2211146 RepID=A0A328BC12_9BACT|nr:hypothetical protein [Hymenobacter edaphi]RAK64623.1 hypothetical protein DLM85_18215 [Hymenobacter edaphi]
MKHLYLLALAGALLASCDSGGQKGGTADVGADAPADSINIQIAALPPNELPAGSDPQQLAEFAWAEFFALNWQSSFPKDGKRDSPDNTWSFSSAGAYPPLVVWETYAHRTELRPFYGQMQAFDNAPHYSFGDSTIQAYPGSKASFTLFDNIDENNEIGSCNLYAHADSLNGQPNPNKRMVLYQAKVNRDEYEYIRANYPTKARLLKAMTTTAANIKNTMAYYPNGKGQGSCACPPGDSVICLPCGNTANPKGGTYTGAMEVKTAWRQLTAQDDTSTFFTRKVLYYRQLNGKTYYDNAVFALIGLHIIHKTFNYPEFVFATFEHNSVRQPGQGYRYVLLNKGREIPGSAQPPHTKPILPLTERVTAAAHRKLKGLNPNSIWLNYRLAGVKGTPTADSTAANFFLANFVVESDKTLADFHGSGIGTPHNFKPNILAPGGLVAGGGCQGCHGVAQLGGTDFSFLLDTVGKPVKAPDIDQTQRLKLLRYIRATAAKR